MNIAFRLRAILRLRPEGAPSITGWRWMAKNNIAFFQEFVGFVFENRKKIKGHALGSRHEGLTCAIT